MLKKIGFGGIILSLFFACGAVPVLAAPNISMTVRAANEGFAKHGSWTNVLVELNNVGSEVGGELIVEVRPPNEFQQDGGRMGPSVQYVVPVSLPAGARKRVPVEVPLSGWGDVHVEFRAGGDLVAETDLSLVMLAPDAALIGVLSGDELGLPALTRSGIKGSVHVIRLDADSLPSRASMMDQYTTIALSRFDSGKLTKEQGQALAAWVGQGGSLILAGGPEWRRSFAGLPTELLPVQVTGTTEVDLSPIGDLVKQPLVGRGTVSTGSLVRGQVLARSIDGETPLVVLDRVGSGRVLYLAADPGLDPLVLWLGQADLFTRFGGMNQLPVQFAGDNRDSMMAQALQRMQGLGLPSMGLIGSILLGYIVLIGPINYLVLKRLDRAEWSWVTIPALSIVILGAVYGLGMGKRTPLLTHLITITESTPATGAATQRSYVGLYSPAKSSLSITMEDVHLVRPIVTFGEGGIGGGTGRVIRGEKTRLELTGLNNYSMKAFAMERDLATVGGLDLVEFRQKDGVTSGRVANRTGQVVTDLVLAFGGMTGVQVGTLAVDQVSEPIVLQVGLGDMGKGMPIMQFGPQSSGGNDFDTNRRQQIWYAVFEQYQGFDPNTSGMVTIAGWTPLPIGGANPSLSSLGQLHLGGNLVISTLPIPYDASSGDVPAGIVVGVPTDMTNLGRSMFGYMLQGGTYTFQFHLPPLNLDMVSEMILHVNPMGARWSSLTMSALNRKTGLWVNLLGQSEQSLQMWRDFVGGDGMLQVKLQTNEHFEITPLTISTKGGQ